MSLDGARTGPSAASHIGPGATIVVTPVLTGGDPLNVDPGEYRFADVTWDAEGIRLTIAEA